MLCACTHAGWQAGKQLGRQVGRCSGDGRGRQAVLLPAKLQFMQVLSEATDPDDASSKLFRQVIDMAATHGVDPAREGYPDVIALPRKDLWVRTKITPSSRWVATTASG